MELRETSKQLRKKALGLYHQVNAGHIACSLSCIDLISAIFFNHKNKHEDFILSKGHAAVALYVTLHAKGEISDEQLQSFYQDGTQLPAHPAPQVLKSIPFATGSLGHGFPLANGIAKSNKLNHSDDTTYVIMSDGETNEGTTWEAAHFAVHHQLNKLIVIIDKNQIQGFGRTEDVMGDTANAQKWELIGFEVHEIDGHQHEEIDEAIQLCKESKNNKPKLIIANTIKGKGVSYMENTIDWHYWPMDEEKYQQAISEIEKM